MPIPNSRGCSIQYEAKAFVGMICSFVCIRNWRISYCLLFCWPSVEGSDFKIGRDSVWEKDSVPPDVYTSIFVFTWQSGVSTRLGSSQQQDAVLGNSVPA